MSEKIAAMIEEIKALSVLELSELVHALEEEFGVTFFQRTTTGVALTEAGTLFYDKCQKIQQLLTELQNEMEVYKCDADDESDRSLHIGISFTARCCILRCLSELHKQFPNVQLKLTDIEQSFLDSETLVPDYDLEIALCGDETYEGIDYLNIAESCLAFCCSKNHPLASRSHVSVRWRSPAWRASTTRWLRFTPKQG